MVDNETASMEDIMAEEDENEVDDGTHEKMLSSLFALDGKKRHKNVVRGVPIFSGNLHVAVHASGDSAKLQPEDLELKRKNVTTELKKPMTALETEKAKRQIARESVTAEMSKWDPVVREIRSAPQTIFSQRPYGIQMHQAMQPRRFQPRTPLETEIYAALGKSEDIFKPDQELTVAEAKALKAMSIKEARARRAELMKHHELLSRMELKSKRQKKIKSKRYRKILRKEKTVLEKKELEQLRKTDPEAFQEKMEQVERARMEERLTLKHRGGSKFARAHKAYSKFDDKTRDAVQDMLQKSRELTKRRQDAESSDDNDNEMNEDAVNEIIKKSVENEDDDDDEEVSDEMKKAAMRARQLDMMKAVNKKAGGWLDGPKSTFVYVQSEEKTDDKEGDQISTEKLASGVDNSDNSNSVSNKMDLATDSVESYKSPVKFNKKRKHSETLDDCELEEKDNKKGTEDSSIEIQGDTQIGSSKKKRKKNKKNKKNVDGNGSTNTEKEKPVKEVILQSLTEDGDENNKDKQEEDGDDDDDGMRLTMEELFEDEDVVEEFAREKAEAEAKLRPKIEDTKLPGWGSWAGPDFKDVKKKVNQKREKARSRQLQAQKLKVKQPFVWINPSNDDSIRKLQPKTVPFPYTSVQQYEASLRQPVSRGFVRETASKLLTKPEVVTKLGHIIKPLDKNDYFKKKDIDHNLEAEKPRARQGKPHQKYPKTTQKAHKGKRTKRRSLK